MGGILEEMCCINHQDVIFNQNYRNHFNSNSKSIEIQHQKSKKEQKEKLPSNQIHLGSARKENAIIQACQIPICSKDVIIQKNGDPFQEYEILEKLGEGTFGKVFKVKNKNNNCIRALKQIEKGFIMNINDSEIGKEIEILRKLNHPYIMKLYEYYANDRKLYLISELCDEGDLQKKIKKIGKFPEFIVKIIMLQVFKALNYLNEKHVIYGDLKLENILVACYDDQGKNGRCKDNNKEDGFINCYNA
jgi:serine/threonine protein kinase